MVYYITRHTPKSNWTKKLTCQGFVCDIFVLKSSVFTLSRIQQNNHMPTLILKSVEATEKQRLLLAYCRQANLPLQLLRYNNNCLFKWIEEGAILAAQISYTHFSSCNIFHMVLRGAIACERGYPMQVSLSGGRGQLQGPDCHKYLCLWFHFFFFSSLIFFYFPIVFRHGNVC